MGQEREEGSQGATPLPRSKGEENSFIKPLLGAGCWVSTSYLQLGDVNSS